jgi:hypothetical protein
MALFEYVRLAIAAVAFPFPLDYSEGPILDQVLRLARFENIYRDPAQRHPIIDLERGPRMASRGTLVPNDQIVSDTDYTRRIGLFVSFAPSAAVQGPTRNEMAVRTNRLSSLPSNRPFTDHHLWCTRTHLRLREWCPATRTGPQLFSRRGLLLHGSRRDRAPGSRRDKPASLRGAPSPPFRVAYRAEWAPHPRRNNHQGAKGAGVKSRPSAPRPGPDRPPSRAPTTVADSAAEV